MGPSVVHGYGFPSKAPGLGDASLLASPGETSTPRPRLAGVSSIFPGTAGTRIASPDCPSGGGANPATGAKVAPDSGSIFPGYS